MRPPGFFFPRLPAAAIVIAAVLTAPPAAAEEPGALSVRLAAEGQPPLPRPELQKLKDRAEKSGRSLAEQIDAEVAKLVPPDDADLPDMTIDDLDLMEITDLKLVAKQYGIPLEEAIDRHGWEEQFSEAHRRITEKFGDRLAGAAIVDTASGDRGAWFAFSGEIPEGVGAFVKALPVEVQLVGGRGYTRMELQQEADRAASRIPAGVSAMVAPDVRTGEILVRAQQSRSVKSSAELRPEPAANPRIKFRVELVSDTPVRQVDGWLRGGGLLDLKDGGSLCTIGFNIHKDGMRSPSTAGHCAKSTEARRYANHSGDGGSTEIQRKLYYEGPEGDFARYGPGTMTSTDTYYYDWNQKRYVDQVATYAMTNEPGKTLCKFGRASGAVCGTVNSVGVSYVNPGGVTVGRQVYMNGGACIGGDSGGPFYWGGNAYGLTSATSNGNCWFSQARFIPNALNGWQVVTR